MTDKTRYKVWRSGPEPELHVIVYEGAELPRGISSLGPWLGSREGEIANGRKRLPRLQGAANARCRLMVSGRRTSASTRAESICGL